MPMPLDVELSFKDGSREIVYIPQYLMFGEKQNESPTVKRTVGQPWKWTHPTYTIAVDRKLFDLKKQKLIHFKEWQIQREKQCACTQLVVLT